MKLHTEFRFPITPKLHIIFEHLPEYFEMTGKTLRRKTHQTVEVTHSKLDKFIKNHNYQIRDVTSEKAGEFLLKAIKHFNSYNLGKKIKTCWKLLQSEIDFCDVTLTCDDE